MSHQGHAQVAIEWSPTQVEVYDGQSRQYRTGPTLAEIASGLPSNVNAIIGISRRSSFVKTLRVPDVSRDEIQTILEIQIGALFPVPAHELAFDFWMTQDVSSEGRLVVVAAVRAETLRHVKDELKRVNIRAAKLMPVSFSAPLFASYFEETDCAVVEHTSEGVAIDIVSKGVLAYSRVAPLPKDSEGLDAEVCRTFSIAKVPCAKVLGAGGLTFDGVDRVVTQRSLEILLAGQDKVSLNLELPEKVAERKRKKIQAKVRLVALLWAAVAVAGLLVYMDRHDAAVKVRSADSKSQNSLRVLRSTKSTVDAKLAAAKSLDTSLQHAFKPAQSFGDVITVISNLAPQGVWLTSVNMERGRELQIRGTALRNELVSTFVQTLAAQARFRDVKMGFANNASIEDTPIVNFTVTARAVGNVPVVEDTKAGKKR